MTNAEIQAAEFFIEAVRELSPALLADFLIESARRTGPPNVASMSFGGPDGQTFCLVTLTAARTAEVHALLPKLAGVKEDPVIEALRARVAELEALLAAIGGESVAE